MNPMLRIMYELGLWTYFLCSLPRFIKQGKHKDGWDERHGVVSEEVASDLSAKPCIWLHAVSVGEVRLACQLLRQMNTCVKDVMFVLTTTTKSGKEVALSELQGKAHVLYTPLDYRSAVKRFLDQINPTLVVIFETEIWPNMLSELFLRRIPVVITNARISDKAFKSYERIRFLMKPLLSKIDLCLAQSKESLDRYIALGVLPKKAKVTGNMKFDLTVSDPSLEIDKALEALLQNNSQNQTSIVLAASTHSNEEEKVLKSMQELWSENQNLVLAIAPRHLERIEDILKTTNEVECHVIRLTQIVQSYQQNKKIDLKIRSVILIDVWGVLNQVYAYADYIFVGGSLVPFGGHNLVEPALWGKTILHGPWMHNFKDMMDLFTKENASILVQDEKSFVNALRELIHEPEQKKAYGDRAKRLVDHHRGATQKNIEEILECLPR